MKVIVRRLTADHDIDQYGPVKTIFVRLERDQYMGKAGDIGLVIWEQSRSHPANRNWTIHFENGNTGMQYPSLEFMIAREIEDGGFSFYLVTFQK